VFSVTTRPGLSRVQHLASPIRAQTVVAIRNQIMEGVLRPGQRLVERALCEQLDVSRNTLREAYRQLEAEGFVEIRPHKGPTVRRITDKEARSLYELRQALEGLAIRLFTQRATGTQLAELERAFEALQVAHASGDVSEMLHRKHSFYDVLYRGADNDVLSDHARVLQGRLAQLRARSLSTGGRPSQSIREIADVVAKVVARDSAAAEEAWSRHIHSAYLAVERAMAEQADSA
jgi:DNA-binding GntR family transcriptional regulator